jgi:hypothetical protein
MTTSLSWVAVGAVVTLATTGFPQPSLGQGQVDLSRYQGTYLYVGSSERGRDTIQRAIQQVTDEMGFLRSQIAQDRLQARLEAVHRIVIRAEEDGMAAVQFQGATYRSKLDGSWTRARTPAGEWVQVRHRSWRGRLAQEIKAGKGRRTNVYTQLGDGRLRLDVTIASRKLPSDIRYDLIYRKAR